MKTLKTISITVLKSLCILSLIFNLSSCSSDDDVNSNPILNAGVSLPAELITTYKGFLGYEGMNGADILDTEGTATISGNSSNYTIMFNNSVPSISGIRFSLINEQYIYTSGESSVDPDEAIIIRFDDELNVSVDRDGNSWAFRGTIN